MSSKRELRRYYNFVTFVHQGFCTKHRLWHHINWRSIAVVLDTNWISVHQRDPPSRRVQLVWSYTWVVLVSFSIGSNFGVMYIPYCCNFHYIIVDFQVGGDLQTTRWFFLARVFHHDLIACVQIYLSLHLILVIWMYPSHVKLDHCIIWIIN